MIKISLGRYLLYIKIKLNSKKLPRKRKQDVKVNNTESLESLMQETYNDACLQINDAQRAINELSISANPEGVSDLTQIAKEKGGLLKVKDSAIRIKLELAKLQNEVIKNQGGSGTPNEQKTTEKISHDDFKSIRDMLKKPKDNNDEVDGE